MDPVDPTPKLDPDGWGHYDNCPLAHPDLYLPGDGAECECTELEAEAADGPR